VTEADDRDATPLLAALIDLINQGVVIDGRNDPADFYRELAQLATEAANAAQATLFLAESSQGSIISVVDFRRNGPALPGRRLRRGEGVAGQAFASARTERHAPAAPHAQYVEIASDEPARAIVACPIRHQGSSPLGVLCAINPLADEDFTDANVAKLETLAGATGAAIGVVRTTSDIYEVNRQLRESVDRTATLYSLAVKVADRRPLEETLEEITNALRVLFRFERAAVLLAENGELRVRVSNGLPAPFTPGNAIAAADSVGDTPGVDMTDAVREAHARQRAVVRSVPFSPNRAGRFEISSYAAVPLESAGASLGVLLVARGWEEWGVIEESEIKQAGVFLAQLALAVDQALGLERRESAYRSAVRAMADSLESHDLGLSGHSARLVRYALFIADRLGWGAEEKRRLEMGCLLHDIGKTVVASEILTKAGTLTANEYERVKEHALAGSDAVVRIEFLRDVAPLIRSHHERWDGRGYPDGLKGADIPPGARIIALVDAFDIMTRERPHAPALSVNAALAELSNLAGVQFDPELVRILTTYPFALHED